MCVRNAAPHKVAANPNLICWRETHPLVACNEQEDALLCQAGAAIGSRGDGSRSPVGRYSPARFPSYSPALHAGL